MKPTPWRWYGPGDQPVTDIVERLRAGFFCREDAADEIERLRAARVEHQASADSESAMQRLLAAAGWDAGSIRHKQLEDALDVAGLRITDEPQTAQQLEIDSLKGAMRVLEEGYDRIKAERDAALAQPQTPSGSWQPIETYDPSLYPKGVLVVDRGHVNEAYFNGENETWWLANTSEHDFDACQAIYPTHWMPLPEAPSLSRPNGETP